MSFLTSTRYPGSGEGLSESLGKPVREEVRWLKVGTGAPKGGALCGVVRAQAWESGAL